MKRRAKMGGFILSLQEIYGVNLRRSTFAAKIHLLLDTSLFMDRNGLGEDPGQEKVCDGHLLSYFESMRNVQAMGGPFIPGLESKVSAVTSILRSWIKGRPVYLQMPPEIKSLVDEEVR